MRLKLHRKKENFFPVQHLVTGNKCSLHSIDLMRPSNLPVHTWKSCTHFCTLLGTEVILKT